MASECSALMSDLPALHHAVLLPKGTERLEEILVEILEGFRVDLVPQILVPLRVRRLHLRLLAPKGPQQRQLQLRLVVLGVLAHLQFEEVFGLIEGGGLLLLLLQGRGVFVEAVVGFLDFSLEGEGRVGLELEAEVADALAKGVQALLELLHLGHLQGKNLLLLLVGLLEDAVPHHGRLVEVLLHRPLLHADGADVHAVALQGADGSLQRLEDLEDAVLRLADAADALHGDQEVLLAVVALLHLDIQMLAGLCHEVVDPAELGHHRALEVGEELAAPAMRVVPQRRLHGQRIHAEPPNILRTRERVDFLDHPLVLPDLRVELLQVQVRLSCRRQGHRGLVAEAGEIGLEVGGPEMSVGDIGGLELQALVVVLRHGVVDARE
eukprot:scaffold1298_cov257-Pinguiococcus_pyrenoidosus.AAC.3